MAIVTGLFIYPVKSCGGIKLSEAHLLETGLAHDRQWMLVDADGRFVTQRTHPAMALIQTALEADVLRLRAPGMGTDIEVPVSDFDADAAPRLRSAVFRSEVQTLVEGPLVNQWLSQYLGQPIRLVRADPTFRRQCKPRWEGDREVTTWLPDAYPLLVVSQGSLDALNRRLVARGAQPVGVERFRPNIVIHDDELQPHEEDDMERLIGPGYVLQMVAPCARCPMPNLDAASGRFQEEPTRTLREYRLNRRGDNVLFGTHAFVAEGAGSAQIRVGDAVEPE